jgi:hypothetical protein
MPAGETLTLADLFKEGEAALAIPPEKRAALLTKMDVVYIRGTDGGGSNRRSSFPIVP